jgi:hypothetical protein
MHGKVAGTPYAIGKEEGRSAGEKGLSELFGVTS